MAEEVEPSHQYPITFCCHETDGSEGQSDRMPSDMEVRMKQRCATEFLHEGKMSPAGIHQCLLNFCGDQTVDVITVRWLVVCFSSGDGRALSLVQVLMSVPCRLLFIAGNNLELMMVTTLKNSVL